MYFEAFCRRYSAQSASDLRPLKKLLRSAEKRAMQEVVLVRKEPWPHDPMIERFTGEKLASRLSELVFAWHECERNEKHARLMAMAGLISQFAALRRTVEDRVAALMGEPEVDNERPNRVMPPSYRRDVFRQVATRANRNILAIGLQVSAAREEAREAWLQLAGDASSADSFFARFVQLCGEVHFGNTTSSRHAALRRLRNTFTHDEVRENVVFAYDPPRFADIIAQAEKAMQGV
jgi:hypothetical protein